MTKDSTPAPAPALTCVEPTSVSTLKYFGESDPSNFKCSDHDKCKPGKVNKARPHFKCPKGNPKETADGWNYAACRICGVSDS